jgi:deoxyribonuclease V
LPNNANTSLVSNFSINKAQAIQREIAKYVIKEDNIHDNLQYVAGVDVAYTEKRSIGAAIVMDYNSLSILESKTSNLDTKFPYISTLLAFRETPPMISAIKRLHIRPEIFLIDGHGLMHPRRIGLASHLGVVLNKPTIGVAKTPLIGRPCKPKIQKEWTPIMDNDEVVGAELISKRGVKPIYISIGHMTSLSRAIEIVSHCISHYRIPEPLRQAHIKALETKRKLLSEHC